MQHGYAPIHTSCPCYTRYMIIAVDTGGTKTLVTAFVNEKKSHKRFRFPTPQKFTEYITQLSQLLHDEYDLSGVSIISIAIPGVVKDDKIVSAPHLSWQNIKIVSFLRKALPQYTGKIIIENDANLAGLAEAHALPSIPKTCLYVTISTGIGTGIITEGIINPYLRLSEGGHMQLEYDGILRDWDQFASGLAIYTTHGKYANDIHDKRTWEFITDKIARGFYALIPILHPDTIVIGGSIGTYFARYNKTLDKLIDSALPSYIDRPVIRQAQHPEEAVIYGCHLYALQHNT